MNIPNFVETPLVDSKGNLTEIWRNILNQLISELQDYYSEEGLVVPEQTAAVIGILNTALSTGALLYNTDSNKLMINENGEFKTVITSSLNTVGIGSCSLGANSPATNLSAPYTWVKIQALDGTNCYVPAWK